MISNTNFKQWAIANNFDISYNVGSKYYNSKNTRIAYFQWGRCYENRKI